MKEFNCPNCGAPITSDECPYCKTKFIDWGTLKPHEPFYLKLDTGKSVIFAKAYIDSYKAYTADEEAFSFYSDQKMTFAIRKPEYKLSIDMSIIEDPDGFLVKKYIKELMK